MAVRYRSAERECVGPTASFVGIVQRAPTPDLKLSVASRTEAQHARQTAWARLRSVHPGNLAHHPETAAGDIVARARGIPCARRRAARQRWKIIGPFNLIQPNDGAAGAVGARTRSIKLIRRSRGRGETIRPRLGKTRSRRRSRCHGQEPCWPGVDRDCSQRQRTRWPLATPGRLGRASHVRPPTAGTRSEHCRAGEPTHLRPH